jgi:hypothetical protein
MATILNASTYAPVTIRGSQILANISGTEAMRIDSSGNFIVGKTTSATGTAGFNVNPAGNGANIPLVNSSGADSTNGTVTYQVYSTSAGAFRFYVGYGGTVYATSTTISGVSDARLKENVNTISNGLNIIDSLNPVTYNFKDLPICNDGKVQHYGFLAQEVQQVLPNLVSEGLNELEDGSKCLTLKMGDMLPILVKAIQELKSLVDTQATEIAALQAKVGI